MPLPDFLVLPERPAKPRTLGLTHVIDRGFGVRHIADLLETAGPYIDILKLGWGTSYVTPNLTEKLRLYQEAGLTVYLGGSFFEVAWHQGRVKAYTDWLVQLGIDTLEVSNGMCSLLAREKLDWIRTLSREFTVFAEVGSKDPNVTYPPSNWADWSERDLEAGAAYVILEGRESGLAGIFDLSGNLREDIIEAVTTRVPQGRLIFEVPNRRQQRWFIRHLGSNVNLGNIQPEEVIALETLRLGLRSDTFHLLEATAAPVPATGAG